MRYTYNEKTGVLKPVKYVYQDGKTISNPPDSLVDELNAGYPLMEEARPEYDPETQTVTPYYEQGDTVIYQKWRVDEIEPEPDEVSLEERITALEQSSVTYIELAAAYERGVQNA